MRLSTRPGLEDLATAPQCDRLARGGTTDGSASGPRISRGFAKPLTDADAYLATDAPVQLRLARCDWPAVPTWPNARFSISRIRRSIGPTATTIRPCMKLKGRVPKKASMNGR